MLPTVVVPFKALKPGVVPEKPAGEVKRLILEEDTFMPIAELEEGGPIG